MLDRERRINAFKKIPFVFNNLECIENQNIVKSVRAFQQTCGKAEEANVWFTKENIKLALLNIFAMLEGDHLEKWMSSYNVKDVAQPLTIGVVMAGNIPMVGFHDFLCVLMSGHVFKGKLSHDDLYLLPALAEVLIAIEPDFANYIFFTDNFLKEYDAVIATGSNNTARHFEYYFGNCPHIIRRNRNGVGVIRGDESEEDFENLSSDITAFFGLGCRSVSSLMIPRNYDLIPLLEVLAKKDTLLSGHARYYHNYEYNRTILLLEEMFHYDNGTILMKESDAFHSPVSVLNYRYYDRLSEVEEILEDNKDEIQCVVCKNAFLKHSFEFGKAQTPSLKDYADGVDTMKFLISL
jgi:hypothetical protein